MASRVTYLFTCARLWSLHFLLLAAARAFIRSSIDRAGELAILFVDISATHHRLAFFRQRVWNLVAHNRMGICMGRPADRRFLDRRQGLLLDFFRRPPLRRTEIGDGLLSIDLVHQLPTHMRMRKAEGYVRSHDAPPGETPIPSSAWVLCNYRRPTSLATHNAARRYHA